jgi:N-methylhydantoinase B
LESAYPLRVRRYELVRGSGGRGRFRGGLGIRRETEVLAERSTISLMGERQRHGPWGLFGGDSGSPGAYGIVRENRITRLSSKTTFSADSGDVLTVTTPGGGGYGAASRRTKERIAQDRVDGKA